MADQRADRRSAIVWTATIPISAVGIVLTLLARHDLIVADWAANVACAMAGVLYTTLGALIVRRAGNLVGWLLQGVGLGLALLS